MSSNMRKLKPVILSVMTASVLLSACGGGSSGATSPVQDTVPAGVVVDKTIYSAQANGSLTGAQENAATTAHTLNINGDSLQYHATAGHLHARALSSGAPQAAFFYVAYTLDNQNLGTRPVTFFYNGGPGSDTVWLHLGSFGPQRLATGIPSMQLNGNFKLVDNSESLLKVSDLVFVNAIGTGYSQALAPNTNQNFWGVDVDAAAFRDFVLRYIEVNARKDSPKYLFGESYGGTRTPVLASLLEMAGTRLEGLVLQSPAMNYNDDCALAPSANAYCGGLFPTLAATAHFHQKIISKPTSLDSYMQEMRDFNAQTYSPALAQWIFSNQLPSAPLLQNLSDYAGLTTEVWRSHFDMAPVYYRKNLIPNFTLGRLDSRMLADNNSSLASNGADPSFNYIKPGFAQAISSYLHDQLKYWGDAPYVLESDALSSWNFKHAGQDYPDVVPDLGAAMTLNPKLRVVNMNGYHDTATPFLSSELELSRLKMSSRIAIRNYAGGHMTYLDDATRAQQVADLRAFYQGQLSTTSAYAARPILASAPPQMQAGAPFPSMPTHLFLSSKPDGWLPTQLPKLAGVSTAVRQKLSMESAIQMSLKKQFASALPLGAQTLNRQQAQAAGMAMLVKHFDAIDVTHRGEISAQQWVDFLQRRKDQ